MDSEVQAISRFTAGRAAHLGTVRPDGSAHVVPVVFAYETGVIYFAVDQKPKSTRNLQRLTNITATPQVSVLVDRYDDAHWSQLWWVRADGFATILADDHPDTDHGIDLLVAKYRQYQLQRPQGPVVAIDSLRWRWWSALS